MTNDTCNLIIMHFSFVFFMSIKLVAVGVLISSAILLQRVLPSRNISEKRIETDQKSYSVESRYPQTAGIPDQEWKKPLDKKSYFCMTKVNKFLLYLGLCLFLKL